MGLRRGDDVVARRPGPVRPRRRLTSPRGCRAALERHGGRFAGECTELAALFENRATPGHECRKYAGRHRNAHSRAGIALAFLAKMTGDRDFAPVERDRTQIDLHFCRLAERALAGAIGDLAMSGRTARNDDIVADHHVAADGEVELLTFLHLL